MRMRSIVLCVFSLLTLFLAIGCSKSESPRQEAPPAAVPGQAPEAAAPGAAPAAPGAGGGAVADGKAFFEQKCSVCHVLSRGMDRRETRQGWTDIVKRMQGMREGWISDAEAAKIIDFLAAEHGKK